MRRCLVLTLVILLVALVSGTPGQEPPGAEEPVRLKKKKRMVPEGSAEPDKPGKKEMPKEEKKTPASEKDKAGRDDESADTEAEEREVLERIARNVKVAEERLANRELGESTRQVQQDVLKDIDALIKKASQPPDGGQAEGGNSSQDQAQGQQGQGAKGGGAANKGAGRTGTKSGRGRGRQSARGNRQGSGQKNQAKGGSQPRNGAAGKVKGGAQPQDGPDGKNGGQGGRGQEGQPNRAADLYKDIWGHLPKAVRAEMDAYFNDKQFMAKYDDLIKRYYSAIAEQGRPRDR